MRRQSFTFRDVIDFIQTAIADQAAVWSDQCGLLADQGLLEFGHLRDMITVGAEFFGSYAFIDAS